MTIDIKNHIKQLYIKTESTEIIENRAKVEKAINTISEAIINTESIEFKLKYDHRELTSELFFNVVQYFINNNILIERLISKHVETDSYDTDYTITTYYFNIFLKQ